MSRKILVRASERALALGRLGLSGEAALVFYSFLFRVVSVYGTGVTGNDEPRVAGIAREMAIRGDYFIPRLNGENFLEYPSLGYVPYALVSRLLGAGADGWLAAVGVLAGLGVVWLTYRIGRALAGRRVGLTAGFLLSSVQGFALLCRLGIVDPVLVFCVVLSLHGFALAYRAIELDERGGDLHSSVFFFAMGLGFLAKGLIGIAVPAATAGAFLLARRDLRSALRLRPLRGALCFALPIGIWMLGAARLAGVDVIGEVFRQSLQRFSASSTDHAAPVYYYLLRAPLSFLPWLPLLFGLLFARVRPVSSRRDLPDLLRTLSLSWFLVVLLGLSASSAKRIFYLGPIYPAFALLAAQGWERIRARRPSLSRLEVPALLIVLAAFALEQGMILLPSERHDSLRHLFATVAEARRSPAGPLPVALFDPSETVRGASFFYLGERAEVVRGQQLAEWLAKRSPAVVVVSTGRAHEPALDLLAAQGFRSLGRAAIHRTSVEAFRSP